MKRSDIIEGMTVRIGPNPSTTTTPYHHDAPSLEAGYVEESAAGKTGTVTLDSSISGADNSECDYTDVIVTYLDDDGDECEQYIHPAHLEPATAEAAPETRASFDDIVGGTELDDLRELGDQLDTLAGKATAEPTDAPTHTPYPIAADDAMGLIDDDGDALGVQFRSQQCSNHGYEAAIVIQVNDDAVLLEIGDAVKLARWLISRAAKAQVQKAEGNQDK